MCPTLEQILSRSLMRGKFPTRMGTASSSSSSSAAIPSLKVPQAKPATIHRAGSAQVASSSAFSEKKSSQQTSSSSTSSFSSIDNNSNNNNTSIVGAFSGLSSPHYSADPREKIRERPERGGLRSLQDLPSLMHSAVALDEWQSALSALGGAIDLVVNHHRDSNDNANTNHHGKKTSSSSPEQQQALLSVRKMIAVDHFAAAARVCSSNNASDAFEKFMESKMNEIISNNFSDSDSDVEKGLGKSNEKKNQDSNNNINNTNNKIIIENNISAVKEEMTDITTEALCESGNWENALHFYEKLGKENRQTVGSLNACINACGTKRKLWETALNLAMPSIQARERELLQLQTIKENLVDDDQNDKKNKDSHDDSLSNASDPSTSSSSAEPLSHFGYSSSSSSTEENHDQKSSTRPVVANAVTYASLISTLENCGRSVEASQILKNAPPAEREAVLTSYVALLQVWSDNHGKKSMRRF